MAIRSISAAVPPYRDLPAGLQLHGLQDNEGIVVVSFSLGCVAGLTGSELAIARLVGEGLSNDAIARIRATARPPTVVAVHTGVRPCAPRKLKVPCRSALALIPELSA